MMMIMIYYDDNIIIIIIIINYYNESDYLLLLSTCSAYDMIPDTWSPTLLLYYYSALTKPTQAPQTKFSLIPE